MLGPSLVTMAIMVGSGDGGMGNLVVLIVYILIADLRRLKVSL